ncbi:MAG: hypothetical protein AVDCRST_MAG73-1258, partial [uncultured Thermomicrobiales bacterium]
GGRTESAGARARGRPRRGDPALGPPHRPPRAPRRGGLVGRPRRHLHDRARLRRRLRPRGRSRRRRRRPRTGPAARRRPPPRPGLRSGPAPPRGARVLRANGGPPAGGLGPVARAAGPLCPHPRLPGLPVHRAAQPAPRPAGDEPGDLQRVDAPERPPDRRPGLHRLAAPRPRHRPRRLCRLLRGRRAAVGRRSLRSGGVPAARGIGDRAPPPRAPARRRPVPGLGGPRVRRRRLLPRAPGRRRCPACPPPAAGRDDRGLRRRGRGPADRPRLPLRPVPVPRPALQDRPGRAPVRPV